MIKRQLPVFLFLVVMSPWFLIYLLGFREIFAIKNKPFKVNNQVLLSEINTLQGEGSRAGFGWAGRLVVNKASWPWREAFGRYLESFDAHYLFVEGDLDVKRSTRTSGPILFSLLPFIIAGFYHYCRRGKPLVPALVLFLPLLGAFFDQHYETTSRLPFILGLTWIASLGLIHFFEMKGKRPLKILFLIFFVFEYLRFIHNFTLHYSHLRGS